MVINYSAPPGSDFSSMLERLPDREPRFIVFLYNFQNNEGHQRSKIIFIHWSPEIATPANKMVYASSKESFKRRFEGINKEIQANDMSDLDERELREQLLKLN